MSTKREQAKELLQWYFRLLAEKAGLEWTGDNVAEIESLADLLIDAAKEEVQAEVQDEGGPVSAELTRSRAYYLAELRRLKEIIRNAHAFLASSRTVGASPGLVQQAENLLEGEIG